MARSLGALQRDSVTETAQAEYGVTYAKKIAKEEARIDWSKPACELDCLVRGLSPTPGAWCEFKGERLKILNGTPETGSGAPGTILDDALLIACGDGALRLTRVQRPGKAAMDASGLLRGFAMPRGAKLA
jgi:methionyl-tRNA formyltransferase